MAAAIAAIVLGIICALIIILWMGTVLYYSSIIFERDFAKTFLEFNDSGEGCLTFTSRDW